MGIGVCVFGMGAFAQLPIPNAQPEPPGQESTATTQGQSIKVDVNLVVLHTTVLDDRARFAEGLKQENFRVLEDKVEQKLGQHGVGDRQQREHAGQAAEGE